MKLEKLSKEDATSYQAYRNWLITVAAAKKQLKDRYTKRVQLTATIRKQREILKTLYKEEADLNNGIEELRNQLIDVLPSDV